MTTRSTSQLLMDLSDATLSAQGVYNCKIQRIKNLDKFMLMQAIIPYTWYNITGTTTISNFQNNLMYCTYNAISYTITITPKVIYTKSSLAAELQNQLNATIAAVFTVSYTPSTDAFSIVSAGLALTIKTPLSIYNAKLFGLSSAANITNTTITSTLAPIMTAFNYITAHSDMLTKYIRYSYPLKTHNNSTSILATFLIGDNVYGDMIFYEPKLPFCFPFGATKDDIEEIDIYFKDPYGNIVDFNNIHPVLNYHLRLISDNKLNEHLF